MPGVKWPVGGSAAARIQFRDFREKARNGPGTIHEKIWETIKHTIETNIADPQLSLGSDQALRGDLKAVCRIDIGRYRIFYIASVVHQKAIILLVGYRKAGDSTDAYAEIKRRLKTDEFDHHFSELGVPKPKADPR